MLHLVIRETELHRFIATAGGVAVNIIVLVIVIGFYRLVLFLLSALSRAAFAKQTWHLVDLDGKKGTVASTLAVSISARCPVERQKR